MNRERKDQVVLTRCFAIMALALALLLPAFVVPPLDSSEPPHFDLTGSLGTLAVWMADSGKYVYWIVALGIVLVVSRSGLSTRQRALEALAIVLAAGLLAGGGAWVNEQVVKPRLGVYRPNILSLAQTLSEDGSSLLGTTAEDFYRKSRDDRRKYLAERSQPENGCFKEVPVNQEVCEHWIEEVGYSLPSGHSFAAMFLATFFLALGLATRSGTPLLVLSLFPLWAVLVCFSRTVLRVHFPLDILLGGLEGTLLGAAAFVLVRRLSPTDLRGAKPSGTGR